MNREENCKKLLSILKEARPDLNFDENTKDLIDGEILSSYDSILVAQLIMEKFDIAIDADDFVPENFNSVQTLLDMIERLQ